MELNQRAARLCQIAKQQAEPLQIASSRSSAGTQIFDFGVDVSGSQDAGLLLARVCLADLGEVNILEQEPWPLVSVRTENPVAACMASQYAGWEVKGSGFFAMGSGPMRAAAGREPLFEEIGFVEHATECVGILESSLLPTDAVCLDIAAKCGVEPEQLTLLVAPTSSIAGTLQVAARSVETALHKLHELGFDLSRIQRGEGTAPMPPVAENDLAAIGVTNDAILYGGIVTLQVRGDDASLQKMGPLVPSAASADYGRPFAEIMANYDNDFYKIDPLLFSAAVVEFENLDTGHKHLFGQTSPDILHQSYAVN